MRKHVFYTEIAYFLGIALIALGTAMTVLGNFGISMVVAPAFILHLKMSQIFPWFSFGVAEYVLQAVILVIIACVLRKIKLSYFLSFLTALFYGFLLDCSTNLLSLLPELVLWQRLLIYIAGDLVICAGVALIFHTYIPPEAYEMFVMEISARFKLKLHTVKTVYDIGSLVAAVILSFLLLGSLQGIGIGTVVTAFINGTLIQLFSRLYDKVWNFKDRFSFRGKFEESEETQ